MKKGKVFLSAFLAALLVPAVVSAENVEVDSPELLNKCLNTTENVCKLAKDLNLTGHETLNYILVSAGNDVVLDLNGHTILSKDSDDQSVITVANGAKLTINDSVGTGKIGDGTSFLAIKMTNKATYDNTKVAELVVNGGTLEGYYYSISGNGDRHNTKVTINGGKMLTTNKDDSTAIYQPNDGTLILNGGLIKGTTGIEIRSGKLIVPTDSKVEVEGTGDPFAQEANGNGSTTIGSAIAVAQHTTKLAIDVQIAGGKFSAVKPFLQANIQKNDADSVDKIKIAITGGSFIGTKAVESENFDGFITGGTFSVKPENSELASGKVAKLLDNKLYAVGTENKITVVKAENGTLKVDKEQAVVGETVTIEVTGITEGYEVKNYVVKYGEDKTVEVVNNKFVMPDAEVTVEAVIGKYQVEVNAPTLDVEEQPQEITVGITSGDEAKTNDVLLKSLEANKELAEKVENKKVTVNVDVTKVDETIKEEEKTIITDELVKKETTDNKVVLLGYYDISINVVNTDGESYGKITETSEKIKFTILLPEGIEKVEDGKVRTYYVARNHEGKVELIEAKLSEDGKYLEFETDKFSTYAIAYTDTAKVVEENPKTGDSILKYTLLSALSLSLIGFSFVEYKKRYNK